MSQFEEPKQEDERIESTENLVNVSSEAVAANRESLEATDDAPDDARPFEINVADRIKKLPPYLFAELNALKYAKRREGADVVDLGMGSPTDPPAQSVIDKLAEAVKNPKVHRYGAARGIKNLRAEMAARYLKYYGVRLNPDTEVMATLGSKDALSHTILA
ncbi:MAG: aminotransferase class I/II-fold pyridoxal phosphate-dependent enzyme, partial [Thermoguttaceae bacterium]